MGKSKMGIIGKHGKKPQFYKINSHVSLELQFLKLKIGCIRLSLKDVISFTVSCLFPFIPLLFYGNLFIFLQAYSSYFWYLLWFKCFHWNFFQNRAIRNLQWLFSGCSGKRGKLRKLPPEDFTEIKEQCHFPQMNIWNWT